MPLAKGRFEDVADLRRAFDDEHERIYTFKMEGDRVNFLHWRVNAVVGSSMPTPRRGVSESDDPSAAASSGASHGLFRRRGPGRRRCRCTTACSSSRGMSCAGAAVIEEPTTSVTVFPGHAVRVSLSGYDYRVNGDAL